MSLDNDREEIADVLSDIDGVRGFAFRPTVLNTGDAFPLLESMDNPLVGDFSVTWRIVVVLPGTEKDSMKWFDSHHEEISDVLNEQVGYVTRVEPAVMATGASDRNIMILTLVREA